MKFSSYICSNCSPNFKEQQIESSKEEEQNCHYCQQRKISKTAETLYRGYPSCFSCKKIEKDIENSSSPKFKNMHKHNKTSVG